MSAESEESSMTRNAKLCVCVGVNGIVIKQCRPYCVRYSEILMRVRDIIWLEFEVNNMKAAFL